MTDFNATNTAYELRLKALAAASAANRAAVFDALSATSITAVIVEFDGEGDSGQITDIAGFTGELSVQIPAISIHLQQAAWNADELSTVAESLRDAIETLCYDYLEHEHGGWENNDGGNGTFHFDIAKRSIRLEFNERFSDYINHSHEF